MSETPTNFIRQIIDEDRAAGKNGRRVHTRFPPEPNGYLHIGHAKAICLNYGIAEDYDGLYNLRFDDTNPVGEDMEYVQAQQGDIRWLGYDWQDRLFFASDYYERLYRFAEELIRAGKAFVCDLTPEEMKHYRGSLTEPGKDSPWRERSVEENLELFHRMRAGEFADGSRTLRARIDMASPNLNMRDPVIYRIKREHHFRTGDKWCIYPMYDFTHCLSDALEGITHSLCSLEFEDHRPLYDWFINTLDVPHKPRQIEFARLNLSYTIMSKRKLLRLVKEGRVNGWDDPRMPTLRGMRRRGFTPASIREFMNRVGVAKANSVVDYSLLVHCLREDLNKTAPRVMAVLRPVKLIIDNYPEGTEEWLEAVNNPEDESAGTRQLPFSRELWIERDDYLEDAPRKWFRLTPGKEVRLKHAYYVTCTHAVTDESGEVVEVHCTYDPATRGGWSEDGRNVKGTLHWVSANHAIGAEVRLYDYLFREPFPGEKTGDFLDDLNPDSLEVLRDCKLEPGLAEVESGAQMQFLRLGYFCVDDDSRTGALVFNRTATLRDTWARVERNM